MQMIRKAMTTLLLAVSLLTPVAVLATSNSVAAADCTDAKSCAQAGVCSVDQNGCNKDPQGSVSNLVSTIINLLSLVVGVTAVIMIIIGGLKYITSTGDAGNINSAKNTILYAIVGLIIVALAQVIVRFVINKTTS